MTLWMWEETLQPRMAGWCYPWSNRIGYRYILELDHYFEQLRYFTGRYYEDGPAWTGQQAD